jgi:hypothetical protein
MVKFVLDYIHILAKNMKKCFESLAAVPLCTLHYSDCKLRIILVGLVKRVGSGYEMT